MADRPYPYRSMFVIHDSFLRQMAEIIGADYVESSFDAAVRTLADDDERDDFAWELHGRHGVFRVWVERHEAYLACSLRADEPWFQKGKQLMWERYLASGGDPEAMKKP